ncbi:polysaccharide deacetylase family protein [Clostridium beijerinckii]|uniref:Peptidoglycan/xylan/chitin deacetylase (PgdA/CDA1 family) n=1 Tax=Clostridium beijerinckii TaxID=1520 RepID=A0AAX0B721_CLOBE|nr:polysaccharide deacetylase family protein [Clostridium beijerinckii]MBA8935975.1 peptidoglycan/xylan/chitin deacetylase (PgdA/CDA1 family) [Clostridium beijerinckii]NRT90264.1 peptidoglycan/xylan/chitin deacetylase (PgdA/CDA1 family) [Clostridium beijerinckii]NRU36048.1 peptidoglycan/xylan/chitin deacetylase (PgdA/CDA1 family) [Clostridium beijerinckii]NSB00672.1 peptidoglycan/xylan/chitin deacetylase (PgdA/CDA1 family) [Clostridium beijerinckii]NYC69793.1 peptidoglycan/xylan/chitin deacety
MLKGTLPPKNISYKRLFKNKTSLSILIFSLLFVMFSFYLITHNISYKNSIASNHGSDNTSIDENHVESKNGLEKDPSNIEQNTIQNERSFNNSNLITDNRGVPVLYYHSVREPAENDVTITPENLRIQLEYIKNQGYTTLTLDELKNYLLNNSPIPEKSIVITFDDGYMDNYYNAFPILKNLNMVATIFCITSDLDGSYYLSKEAIKEMSDYGIDIESHTVNHPKLNQLPYDKQLSELKESKETLESITGKKVEAVAYPFGDFNDDSVIVAKNSGYTLAFTTKRGLSDRDDNILKLDRIYISSKYDMNTFKEVLAQTKK